MQKQCRWRMEKRLRSMGTKLKMFIVCTSIMAVFIIAFCIRVRIETLGSYQDGEKSVARFNIITYSNHRGVEIQLPDYKKEVVISTAATPDDCLNIQLGGSRSYPRLHYKPLTSITSNTTCIHIDVSRERYNYISSSVVGEGTKTNNDVDLALVSSISILFLNFLVWIIPMTLQNFATILICIYAIVSFHCVFNLV